jgi:hypothetical protein
MSAHIFASDVVSCAECGAALRSRTCRSCAGTAGSWFCICEACGGRPELLSCPNEASHASWLMARDTAERNYWCGREGQLSNPFLGGSATS